MSDEYKLWRIDPPTCACTDCIVGRSVPIDQASPAQLNLLYENFLANASGCVVECKATYTWRFKD